MAERNWAPRTVWTGDCIEVMRGMNSATIDLIYLDPPFNSNANYAAPIGTPAYGAEFKDVWSLEDVDVEWINLIAEKHPALEHILLAASSDSDKSYLVYMAARLLEMPRLLKPNSSIYLHCDTTMSHYLKIVMDAIFGRQHFRNEIIWSYSGWNKRLKGHMEKRHDSLLFYSFGKRPTFNYPVRPWKGVDEYVKVRKQKVRTDDDGRQYVLSDGGGGKRVRRYLDEAMKYGVPLDDVWDIDKLNNSARDNTGFLTQKPIELLERVVSVSSKPGDMVLDPFCGCATTCVAAENLGRDWVGIDLSPKAGELVMHRLAAGTGAIRRTDIVLRDDVPQRTDIGSLPRPNSRENREALYGQQAGYCAGCATHFELRNLEVDHIIAQSKGGTDHLSNLQLLCGNCNRVKGDRGMEYLRTKLQLNH